MPAQLASAQGAPFVNIGSDRSRHGSRGASAGLRSAVEAAGIEPASVGAPIRASTSLGCALISPGRPVRSRPTAGPAILRCRAAGDWLSLGGEPVSDAASEPRAEPGATRHLTGFGGECEFVIRIYVGSRCLTRPPGP